MGSAKYTFWVGYEVKGQSLRRRIVTVEATNVVAAREKTKRYLDREAEQKDKECPVAWDLELKSIN